MKKKKNRTNFRGSQVVQGVKDLGTCRADIIDIINSFNRYGLTRVVNMYDDPTFKRVKKGRTELENTLKLNPDESFLVVYAIAGHGMAMDGRQVVLINCIRPSTGWYEVWGIESEIRKLAARYTNNFFISIFAACREVFSRTKHRDLF